MQIDVDNPVREHSNLVLPVPPLVRDNAAARVNVSDSLVDQDDPAYITPVPYQQLLDFLDTLVVKARAVAGAGPEAPIVSEASLLHATSVSVDAVCELIYTMWDYIYMSKYSQLNNFVFAEVPIVAEKWGCSIDPFADHTGASTAWMLQGEVAFDNCPVLYTWTADDDVVKWNDVMNSARVLSLPDSDGQLSNGKEGSCFGIANIFETKARENKWHEVGKFPTIEEYMETLEGLHDLTTTPDDHTSHPAQCAVPDYGIGDTGPCDRNHHRECVVVPRPWLPVGFPDMG